MALPELPPIEQPQFDLKGLVSIAALLNDMEETRAKYGSPGTPGTLPTTSADKPWFARLRGYEPKAGQPINGEAGDPSTGLLTEAQGGRMAPGSNQVWVKPGTPATPGKMGSIEQGQRIQLAGLGIYDEEGTQALLKGAPIGDIKVGGKKKRVYINASESDPAKMISQEPIEGWLDMGQDDAIKLVASRMESQIQAKGEMAGYFLRLSSEVNSIKPDERTEQQTILGLAAEKALKGVTGISGTVQTVTAERVQRKKLYDQQRIQVMSVLDEALQTKTIPDPVTGQKRKASSGEIGKHIKKIIEDFNAEYRDDGFPGLDPRKFR